MLRVDAKKRIVVGGLDKGSVVVVKKAAPKETTCAMFSFVVRPVTDNL
mgnify:CR=1 FL=1